MVALDDLNDTELEARMNAMRDAARNTRSCLTEIFYLMLPLLFTALLAAVVILAGR